MRPDTTDTSCPTIAVEGILGKMYINTTRTYEFLIKF